eukprot:m.174264 g.174264  ORF g.174264 m.174264 type:complete len:373 (-) comp13805_c0_seq1:371-1489(-)
MDIEAMDWPEADAPARAEATPEHGSRPHESGKNLDVAPSVRRRLKVSQVVHEKTCYESPDHEDHTFNGVMFDVTCPDILPIDFVRIDSISVRGYLGPMSVFVSRENNRYVDIFEDESAWELVYAAVHKPSPRTLCDLVLPEPILMKPGDQRAIYVHSARPDDNGIVYDNSRHGLVPPENNDRLVVMPSAMAHLNPTPFVPHAPWGFGRGWRRNREFVGKVSYGVRWTLWGPDTHHQFPSPFKEAIFTIMLTANRPESALYMLPPEMIFYILNFINHDAFGTPQPEPQRHAGGDMLRQMFRFGLGESAAPAPAPGVAAAAPMCSREQRPGLMHQLVSRFRQWAPRRASAEGDNVDDDDSDNVNDLENDAAEGE